MAEPSRSPVARLFALAVVGLSAGALGFAGCYGKQCDGDRLEYGLDGGEGSLVDENTWQTTPIEGRWLDFPHRRLWVLYTGALGYRVPAQVTAYVSASPEPNKFPPDEGKPLGNFTQGAGDLAIFQYVKPDQVQVYNSTCADYFVRVVVEAEPFGAARDGGADASDDDAGPASEDAGSDSSGSDAASNDGGLATGALDASTLGGGAKRLVGAGAVMRPVSGSAPGAAIMSPSSVGRASDFRASSRMAAYRRRSLGWPSV